VQLKIANFRPKLLRTVGMQYNDKGIKYNRDINMSGDINISHK